MTGNGFTRKKVRSLTLGEKLKKIRAEYRISLTEVSRNTGIRLPYLEYLENGDYGKLPADVYIRGFLRSYAQFLGADPKALIRMYERERSIDRNLGKEPEAATLSRPKRFSFFVVTPKLMGAIVATLFVFGAGFYLYREYRLFVAEPYLVVLEPRSGQSISEDEVTVAGKTDKDAKLFLNGQPTLVDESGAFRETLHLQPGANAIALRVVNRFGKERSENVSVEAVFSTPEAAPLANTPPSGDESKPIPLTLALSVAGKKSVSIFVRVDGREEYNGPLNPGETKTFECREECSVDSTSGKNTLASKNGEPPLPLANIDGTVHNRIFRAEENAKDPKTSDAGINDTSSNL